MDVAVIGSGRQGTSAGYDLIKSEAIDRLVLIDSSIRSLEKSRKHILKLVPDADVSLVEIDIDKERSMLVDIL